MVPMEKMDKFRGKSIDECKQKAAESFGVPLEDICFEVLEDVKKGLFGKVKSPAVLLAGYDTPPEPEPSFIEGKKKEIARRNKVERAQEFLEKVLDKMGIESVVNITSIDAGIIIDLDCKGSGAVIGRRGETLDALQYLTSLIVNKGESEYVRVSLDSSGYRDKRKETLEALAKKIGEKVQKSGRSTTLEPMNPYERRIIHSAVAEIEGISSKSIGEEPYRKVVISSNTPRKGEFKRNNNRNEDRPKKNEEGPRSLDLKTSFEKDYKKPKPEDDINAGLYGKIEL